MQTKTPISFLPFVVLALILCVAAVLGVYTRFSIHASPTPTPEATLTAIPIDTTSPVTTKEYASEPADAYPSSATATPTLSEHGYPAPGAKAVTPSKPAKDVATDTTPATPMTPVTPTYINYLPVISDGKYRFTMQETGVITTQGFTGCSWSGVAGQVFDLSGNPLTNLVVHLQGTWAGVQVSQDAITGGATDYGPAGFLFVLGTQPLATSNALSVQLFDANRKALSLPITFSTYADCAHNLILVNFIQNY